MMRDYLDLQMTTAAATSTTYLRPPVIVCLDLQTYSRNTALPSHFPLRHMSTNYQRKKETLTKLTQCEQMLMVIRTLALHLDAFVSGTRLPPAPAIKEPPEELRVVPLQQTEEQRVITFQEPPLQRVSMAPPTFLANNPAAPCIL